MKSIKKALKRLGEIFNRLLDSLLGGQSQPELIPIPVRSRSRTSR